ncbi:MAG: class I SAM-dependent methyltransferase [Pseudomonadales bacterium]
MDSMLRETVRIDWGELELPDAWPDNLNFSRPKDILRFLACVFSTARNKVELPDTLPGKERIPKYVLQEFHNLPNGNYSRKITRGYLSGFDRVMLGSMQRARSHIAMQLAGLHSVLDIGCGGGQLAGALHQQGSLNVWGIDPSPYFLQHAAGDFPGIHFVQGVAEQTNFHDNCFDGAAACFLFHELPPKYGEKVLQELSRIVKSEGYVAICEPSPLQLEQGYFSLLKDYGVKALYFAFLARLVHEPFVEAWHRWDVIAALRHAGFEVLSDEVSVPMRHILARRA